MQRISLPLVLCIALLSACAIAGVPRVGRFFGSMNRGREQLFVDEHFDVPSSDTVRIAARQLNHKIGSIGKRQATIQTQWFDQQLVDHFNPDDKRTFSQRFFVNETFWQTGGPVFLLLGGEGPIHTTDVTGHFAFSQQAQQFNAMSISVEHRFYGSSIPLGSTSTENLKYLTVDQALADYASFIQYIKQQNPRLQSSKWIVFGGSYSGNLSAWMRLRYPHLVHGSIASSAPVQAQLDFAEYLVTVSQSLGATCSAQFAKATTQIEQMLSDPSGQGVASLQQLFKTCDAIQSELDKTTFVSNIVDTVAGIVQYNNDNNNYESTNIDGLCSIMNNSSYSSPVNAWAAFIVQSNAYSNASCTPTSYHKQIKEMQVTRGVNSASRSWYWQTCSEFGYYQTAESTNQPFSPRITLQYFLGICTDVYGFPMTPNIDATNSNYGGSNLQSSRIVLPNGSVDPWHTLGVLQQPNLQEHPILINGTAHVADLYPPRSSDLPQLTQTRTIELNFIARWLQLP
jgi:pimeloyl-ACP methyl ester carboxylesterase